MVKFLYKKSNKYNDYDTIYEQCSGPGGLQLAEFIAEKMGLQAGKKMLDVGTNRGYQTGFLAKEYGVFAVGIDPWDDRETGVPMVDILLENARQWGVEDSVLGVRIGVPDTDFAASSFDFVYTTTALEMVRGMHGEEAYLNCIKEIKRLLKPGGILGLGEPMHLPVAIPADLEPFVSEGDLSFKACFRDIEHTAASVRAAGLQIIEADYAPDARQWWLDYAAHDPFAKLGQDGELETLRIDDGRWISFGYVIAKKAGDV